MDIQGKKKILKTNLVDYLENHLASRLEQAELDMQLIQPQARTKTQDKKAAPDPDLRTGSGLGTDTGTGMEDIDMKTQETFSFTKDEAEELEHLLKELFDFP